MKIAVIGAGAIGALVAGYLGREGVDVTLVGRATDVPVIHSGGLVIDGVRGNVVVPVKVTDRIEKGFSLVILTVKTQDIESVLKENVKALGDVALLTVQNGVRAEEIVRELIPKENIISSIVMFGSTYLEAGRILHNFEGDWVIGRAFAPNNGIIDSIVDLLAVAFSVRITEKITGMKWLKLFLNLNNCLPALTGKSMQETFYHPGISCLSIRLLSEALAVVDRASIELESLPDFPVARLRALTAMPLAEAGEIFSKTMTNLSREPLFGSILQSIKRGKPSEIDYFNGEIVYLGRKVGEDVPLNRKMVEMVHRVEESGRFFSPEEILNEIGG
ncbi:MAG: 2-dehydropantoate 2-reductase [Dehalococcoidales bacterium]|nr:2-dehydropantoate 2-reductase [Dehalococcoidales bacterium]